MFDVCGIRQLALDSTKSCPQEVAQTNQRQTEAQLLPPRAAWALTYADDIVTEVAEVLRGSDGLDRVATGWDVTVSTAFKAKLL